MTGSSYDDGLEAAARYHDAEAATANIESKKWPGNSLARDVWDRLYYTHRTCAAAIRAMKKRLSVFRGWNDLRTSPHADQPQRLKGLCRDSASIRELADDFDAYRAAEGLGDPYAAPHRHDDPATLAVMRGEDGPITVRHERFNTPKALLEAADPVAVGQAFDCDTLLNVIELLKGRRSLRWDWKSKAIRKGEVTSGMMHGAAADECDGIISTIEGKLREMRDASIQPPVPK